MAEEREVQGEIIDYLRDNGYITMNTDMMIALKFIGKNKTNRIRFIKYAKKTGYTNGQSDIVATNGIKTYFLEVKGENGTASKEQKELERILDNYHFVRSLDDVKKILTS